MLARLGQIFSAFLTQRFEGVLSSTVLSIAQDFAKKGRQTLFFVMASFIFSLLLSAGVIMGLLEASSQFDTRGVIYFSAMLTSSLILTGVSLVALGAMFWPRSSPSIVLTQQPQSNATAPMSIEDILTVVIAEGVQYFKNKNHEKSTSHS
jgi:hypothetical protein